MELMNRGIVKGMRRRSAKSFRNGNWKEEMVQALKKPMIEDRSAVGNASLQVFHRNEE